MKQDYSFSALSRQFERDIEEIRKSHKGFLLVDSERIPVIVQTVTPLSNKLSVQYWTEDMIKEGEAANGDQTISYFVDRLSIV